MLTVEQENHRTNLQFAILGTGGVGLAVNFLLPPIWALYFNCITTGVQAFLVSSLIRLLLQAKKPTGDLAGLLPLISATSAVTCKPYINKYGREKWVTTNEFLAAQEMGAEIVLLEAVILDA